jgi:hypothetical protein
MCRYGLTVVACLMLAGGLMAGQTGAGLATAGASSALRLPESVGGNPAGFPSRLVPNTTYDNDVGVSALLPVPDVYVPFGDTVFPRCEVKNFGLQTQTNVPVVCVYYDTAVGARIYGPETVYVASLDSGSVDTVEFPAWLPPAEDKVYFDTMATALPGDEEPLNDWWPGRVTVSDWGLGHLSYNDGTFENAYSWVTAGSELTERFVAPEKPLTVSKAVLWVTSFSGEDYDAEVRGYANNGSPHGYPGTVLGTWSGQLHTDSWMFFYKNEILFDPPIEVDYDTFFVSYYQTDINPAYIYLAVDTIADTFDIYNDWGRYAGGGGGWGLWPFDGMMDFGIDAYYDAPLLDGSSKEIVVPQGEIDSNTTFTPQVLVKNAGLLDRGNIPAEFYIIRTSDVADTVYAGTANSGPVGAGQTKVVTFADSVTLDPGQYTVTSVTLLPYDARPVNDTLVGSLSVGLGIGDANVEPGRASVSIAPNPLENHATVRYSLPKAGLVTLNLFDVTGRTVLSQTLAAGRTGTASLDLRKLEAGVYVVKVASEGFSTTKKLVVEH